MPVARGNLNRINLLLSVIYGKIAAMEKAPESLSSDTKVLHDTVWGLQLKLSEKDHCIEQKDAQIDQLKQQYQHILEQFRLAQQKQFGKSSEVSNDPTYFGWRIT